MATVSPSKVDLPPDSLKSKQAGKLKAPKSNSKSSASASKTVTRSSKKLAALANLELQKKAELEALQTISENPVCDPSFSEQITEGLKKTQLQGSIDGTTNIGVLLKCRLVFSQLHEH